MKKNKLQKILNVLTPDETAVDFKVFDEQVGKLKSQLKEKITVKTLDDVNSQLDKFRKRIDLDPLLETIKKIEEGFSKKADELEDELEEKVKELEGLISNNENSGSEKNSLLKLDIDELQSQLSGLEVIRKNDVEGFKQNIESVQQMSASINKTIGELTINLTDTGKSITESKSEAKKEIKTLQDSLETLRKELLNRINSIQLGGGSMNRKITFGGVNYLTRYTDINFKAGGTITYTIAQNNQTKMVDVTITATGGTGGSVRVIESVSIDTVAGATAGTDYVFLVTGTTKITLPTAVGNTNLYTIKNVGTGVVTVDTTSSQTIDGDLTIIMPVRYTSVDIISDIANWNIT